MRAPTVRSTTVRAAVCTVAAALVLGACSQRGGEEERQAAGGSACQGQDATGITDERIELGGIYPLSGPASAYGDIPTGIRAYFRTVNAAGGIDGREVSYTVRDDGYLPPKAVEEARRLVEQDQVFALFQTLGTPSSTAVREYADERQVPQVFVASGASTWGTGTQEFPWTIGWQPSYVSEARVYADWLQRTRPQADVAVLYQNDDFGKDLLGAFEEAVAGSDVEVVATESYEVTDPTVAPQVRNLARSKADVFLDVTTPKFGSQALAADAALPDWDPLHIVNNVAASPTVLEPVGFDKVQGVVSATYYKDPGDPQWADDPAMRRYRKAMAEHAPRANASVPYFAYGWAAAQSMHATLEQMECPTREGLMEAVRSLDGEQVGMLLPGVELETGEDDAFPIESMQLMRFEGKRWHLQGEVIDTREQYGPVEE